MGLTLGSDNLLKGHPGGVVDMELAKLMLFNQFHQSASLKVSSNVIDTVTVLFTLESTTLELVFDVNLKTLVSFILQK